MVETKTPRFSLPQWSAGTDYYPGRTGFNTILGLLESQAAVIYPSGPGSSMPRSGTFGRFYFATDQGQGGVLYYDGGAGWVPLNLTGGGGPGTPVAVGRAPVVEDEGSRAQAARADHVHTLPLATAANHGALASQHYALLEGAAMIPTAGTLARRDNTGRLTAAAPNPTVANHVVTVEHLGTVGDYRATANTLVRRYENGHFRVPTSGQGVDDAIGRRYVDNEAGEMSIVENSLVRRAGTRIHTASPTSDTHAAPRSYVDSKASRAVWKRNWRPMPYGLPEVLSLDTGVYDYRDGEEVPAEARGRTDVLGSTVENMAETMPLLAVYAPDGTPERINDRELIWPLIAAVQELHAEVEELREQVRAARG